MHIFFSGIGGTGVGPLALIAKQAGFTVSGSDKQHSAYIDYLIGQGVTNISTQQTTSEIAKVHTQNPIDWIVYSSAVSIEQPNHPELVFARDNQIKLSQRDELINYILEQKSLQMIAIAGTHGKTTTCAMAVWLFKRLGIPVSHSFGAKTSFCDMGSYDPNSTFFIYEADEFARNFLSFHPKLSLVVGIDYDHPDIYPTKSDYDAAFCQFAEQSDQVIAWQSDALVLRNADSASITYLDDHDDNLNMLTLVGEVNRRNALQVMYAVQQLTGRTLDELAQHMNTFPGLGRRFERIAPNIYSDYAHTPPKVRGAIQIAEEHSKGNVVVVYEGLHNTRQHFIRHELKHLFDTAKSLYVVPSYLAREDESLPLLSPIDLIGLLSDTAQAVAKPAELNDELVKTLQKHVQQGDTVLCLSAGGGGSLDEWLRAQSF